ncbi:hypothetical protein ANO14919_021500 [Xylariales sp. No.14919]|nr:hypothetical protein ANO14919_021500 [Xylariales sp. No.14919]
MADPVTIDRDYFETLLRRSNHVRLHFEGVFCGWLSSD